MNLLSSRNDIDSNYALIKYKEAKIIKGFIYLLRHKENAMNQFFRKWHSGNI